MTSQPCWRCLARLSIRSRPSISTSGTCIARSQPFSTSISHAAPAEKRKAEVARRGSTRLKLTKKKRAKAYKVPAIGERKALRQRIVLSNTNAREVNDIDYFTPANAECSIGQFLRFQNDTVDGLRTLEAFRRSQGWGYFSRPACLIREETITMAEQLAKIDTAKAEQGEGNTTRGLIVGPQGSGKSVLLLQAQAIAWMKKWVVISFPNARDLTNATTAYAPIPNTSPQQYYQKDYTAALLDRTAKANKNVLSSLPMLQKHDSLPQQLSGIPTLQRLAEIGAQQPDLAWPIFQALWSELNAAPSGSEQKSGGARPPIMMVMDGIAHICRLSNYLAPSMHHIHAHDLSLVKHFVDYFNGSKKLNNGGAVLAADSQSNRPVTPTLDLAIRQINEREAAKEEGRDISEPPLIDQVQPWNRIDERSLAGLRWVSVFHVGNLDKFETRTMLEYYAKSGMLRQVVNEGTVGEAWAMSGKGNLRQLENTTIRGMFM